LSLGVVVEVLVSRTVVVVVSGRLGWGLDVAGMACDAVGWAVGLWARVFTASAVFWAA
jgi:hypothetical protein